MKSIRKYMNLLGSLFLVALIFTISATSVSASAALLSADIVKCDPNPAQIGEYVNVWIKIENIGNTRAEDVSVKLIPSYPFSLDAGDDAVRKIGILSTDRHASLEYHLYVDENARPGTRSIKVLYQDDEGTAWIEEELDIWVGSGSDTFDSRGTIQLEQITTEPEVLMPGDEGTVTFTLKNTATQYSITIDGEEYDTNARIRSATLESTDDINVNSDPYHDTGILGPGDTVDLTYNIEVDDTARDGTKHLEFILVGSSYTYNYDWDIPIKVDSAGIKVIPTKPMTLKNGVSTLEFDIVNTHPSTLNSVSIKPQAEGIEFSPMEYFIGSMDHDELFTVEFDAITVSDNISTSADLKLTARYRNGYNQHETAIDDLSLAIVFVESNGGNGLIGIGLLLAILAVSGFLIYRRNKNKQ
ncbi:MAG: hypothetical protein C5S45_03910 [Candidatus Methanocomedens sp.]|nr:MAG: hypothetical protein C5S45_03910 [ANME-2 cluster archaeon]